MSREPNVAGPRVRALDGLRALAVVSVLIGHGIGTAHPSQAISAAALYLGNCDFGVTLFFVLSGYLITSQLDRERERTGTIDVAGFYLRRALRILPAFYLWLLVVAGLDAAHVLFVPWRELTGNALFVFNEVSGRYHWWDANAWTLCIEQQFYLVFPLSMLRGTRRRSVIVLGTIVVVEPLFRSFVWHASGEDVRGIMWQTQYYLDPLADGCVLAFALRDEAVRRWSRTPSARFAFVCALVVGAIVVPTCEAIAHLGFYFRFAISLYGVCAAIIVAYVVSNEGAAIVRALRVRPLVYLGTISYGLYLWQQLFMTTASPVPFPLNAIAAIAIAAASYHLVERPALRFRRPAVPARGGSAEALLAAP